MRAILVHNDDEGYRAGLAEVDESDLPEGDVTVQIDYSSLNHKDSRAVTGPSRVIRAYPMVAGIDLAGTIENSDSADFSVGDKVILNGWGIGEAHWGGFSQRARVKGEWLVHLPDAFSTRQAMAIGTAGYTAMLCVLGLEQHGVTPEQGDILVTGAAGGVGSVAISVLAKLGYTVVASTGRVDETAYLKELGAAAVIDRNELSDPGRPLGKERWAGAVDVVGSHTLANICATTRYGGTVTACGLAQGPDLPATVMPFILRGVTLAGINCVYCPRPQRIEAWNRLATDLDLEHLELMTSEIPMSAVIPTASEQLAGKTRGRVVVDVNR